MRFLKFVTIVIIASTVGYGFSFAADPLAGVPVLDRKFKEFEPLGFRLGKFQIFSNIETSASYTDNALQTQDNTKSDEILSAVGRFSASTNFGRMNLDIKGDISRLDYQEIDALDRTNFGGSISGVYDLSSSSEVALSAGIKRTHETRFENPTISGIYNPIRVDENNVRAAFSLHPGSLKWNFSGMYRDISYRDTRLSDGSQNLVQRDRDRSVYSFGAVVTNEKYTGTNGSRLVPFLGLNISRSIYDHRNFVVGTNDFTGIDQNKTNYNAVLGVEIQPTGKLRGKISLGYGVESPDDTSQDSSGDMIAKIDLAYLYSPLTNFTFNVNRFFASDSQLSEATLETKLNASVIHELTRQWILNAGIGYLEREFAGGFSDSTWDINAGFTHIINERFSVGGDIKFIGRESNRVGGDYDETRAMIRLNTKF